MKSRSRDVPEPLAVDFAALYDHHPEYVARREAGSFEQAQVDIEVGLFKLPHLLALLSGPEALGNVLEIGCATGELLAALPVARGALGAPGATGARRVGVDISAANVMAAQARFPSLEFICGDFRALQAGAFDTVVLSDVLEHVPDDAEFLHEAARLGRTVLVNLPLEDNWLNSLRHYGPDDVSGHLRRYALEDGLALVRRAGLELLGWQRVWIHEGPAEAARRRLRSQRLGSAFSGGPLQRTLRRLTSASISAIQPLGRKVFASNLFFAARLPGHQDPSP